MKLFDFWVFMAEFLEDNYLQQSALIPQEVAKINKTPFQFRKWKMQPFGFNIKSRVLYLDIVSSKILLQSNYGNFRFKIH